MQIVKLQTQQRQFTALNQLLRTTWESSQNVSAAKIIQALTTM
ncbi:hypothetical protein [Alteromonas flava]|nr:hypothetical protein [Alteromonas flava]